MEVKEERAETAEVKEEQQKTGGPTEEGGQFTCALCSWSERYHAHGQSLPFARGIVFNEVT